jgi:methanogenic corrinoid protein MtbC1
LGRNCSKVERGSSGVLDEERVKTTVQRVLDEWLTAYDAVLNGLTTGMERVGERYDQQEDFVPELLRYADSLYVRLDILKS